MGYFFLKNKQDDNVVDFKDGADSTTLITFPQKTSDLDNQLVELDVSRVPPYLYITSRLTGNVVDIRGSNTAPGTPVVAFRRAVSRRGSDNQLWMLVPSDETEQYFFITSRLKGAGVLTVQGPPQGRETPIVVSPRKAPDAASQLWSLVSSR